MDSYLMMLYVTLDQEQALKSFFVDQGWAFCKPDISAITDKVGPLKPTKLQTVTLTTTCSPEPKFSQHADEAAESTDNDEATAAQATLPSPSRRPLRKRVKRISYSPPPFKQAKKSTKTPSGSLTSDDEKPVDKSTTETHVTSLKNIDGTDLIIREDVDEDITVKLESLDPDNDASQMDDDGDNDDDFDGDDDYDPNAGIVKSAASPTKRGKKVGLKKAEVYTCMLCEQKYKNVSQLRRHQLRQHDKQLYVCVKCALQFTSVEELNEHMKSHQLKVKCQKCGEFVDNLKAHKQFCDTNTTPVCTKCKKTFQDFTELLAHSATCTTTQRYECEVCRMSFSKISVLNRHMQRHNPNGGKYLCQTCDRRFYTYSDLASHEYVHKPKVPCDACGKMVSHLKNHMKLCKKALAEKALIRCRKCCRVFASLEAKAEHMETCKTESHPCEICGIPYTTLGSLQLHNKKHHMGEAGEFVCDTCGRHFHQKSKLRDHQLVHQPKELCQVCNKMVFLTKRHQAFCRNPKMQGCEFCGSIIKGSISHLKRHISRHHRDRINDVEKFCDDYKPRKKTGEYFCKKCGEKYMYKGWVEAHERECQGFGLVLQPSTEPEISEVEQVAIPTVTELQSEDQTASEQVEVAMVLPSILDTESGDTMLTDLATNTVYIIKQ